MAEKTATWNPVVDCIGPLIEALNPLKFNPPLLSYPNLAAIYRQVGVEMCCLRIQDWISPARATDFKNRLDSCLRRWFALINYARKLGALDWDFQQWQRWFNQPDGYLWREPWDDLGQELVQTVEYLQKLAALIEAKVATQKAEKQRESQGNVLETPQPREPSGAVVLTEKQKKILKYLKEINVAIAQLDIETRIDLSKHTVSEELKILEGYGFTGHPTGKKYFVTITQ